MLTKNLIKIQQQYDLQQEQKQKELIQQQQQQPQSHNEILFWKVYHNKYIRYLIFYHLQTMNTCAVIYLLENPIFYEYANLDNINSYLVSSSAKTNNIQLFNYLYDNNRVFNQDLQDIQENYKYNSNISIPFIINNNSKIEIKNF